MMRDYARKFQQVIVLNLQLMKNEWGTCVRVLHQEGIVEPDV